MSLCRTLGGELEELYELRHTSLAVQKMQVVVQKTSAPCPLRSESGRSVALPRSVAMCQNRNLRRSKEHPYSNTSSARASSVGGTSRPSALAALRLRTIWYLVGICTGKSAGFSPLRIRSI